MDQEFKIRELLQRKIKQRMGTNDFATEYSQNFLNQLESMKESYHSEQSTNQILEGEALALQLQQQKESQHQLQLSIDKLRIRMLELVKGEDIMKEKIVEKRKNHAQVKERLEQMHEDGLKIIEQNYELKRGNIAKQIEQLIQEKGQFIGKMQNAAKEIKRAQERNKKAQENYVKEMKSRKEAYLSIERDKSNKYEQGRVQQLKEQAIRDTEPKLLAIIKSANEDIKKAQENSKKELQKFKIEHKQYLQRQLTESKQKAFDEGEQEKEDLRLEIQKRSKERYDQKEREIQSQLSAMKEQYSQRIKTQQAKMQQQMQEFMSRNKDSHHTNIDEIRQLKTSYEAKLKKMNENIRELQQQRLKQYEQKCKKAYELQIKEIEETQDQKYQNALVKIQSDLSGKMDKISKEIVKEQSIFRNEITVKYEKIMLNEQKKLEEALGKQRQQSQRLQSNLINIQKQKTKEDAKTHQMQRERNQLLTKREDFQRKIATYEAELSAFQRLKLQKEKETQKNIEQLNKAQQNRYQNLKDEYLAKEELKQVKMKELLDDFQQESNILSEELQSYRGEIQNNITKRKGELQKLLEENNRLERQNQLVQREIEEESRRLRG